MTSFNAFSFSTCSFEQATCIETNRCVQVRLQGAKLRFTAMVEVSLSFDRQTTAPWPSQRTFQGYRNPNRRRRFQMRMLTKVTYYRKLIRSVSLRVLCQHKLTYFLTPIKGIEEYLDPLDETINITFMPAISGGHQIIEGERNLLSLPP